MKKNIKEKTKKINATPDLRDKLEEYFETEKKLLEKLQLKKRMVITFKNRKKVPFLSSIAIKIMRKQGGILDTEFSDNIISNKK
jgi:hypothetical protein